MILIRKNIDLTPYTTLKVRAGADFFAVIKDKDDLLAA
jgi:UDP-N-acetylenolpyruvoylglucosamine reductase